MTDYRSASGNPLPAPPWRSQTLEPPSAESLLFASLRNSCTRREAKTSATPSELCSTRETALREADVAAKGLSDKEAEARAMGAAYAAEFAVIVHFGARRLSRALDIAAERETEI